MRWHLYSVTVDKNFKFSECDFAFIRCLSIAVREAAPTARECRENTLVFALFSVSFRSFDFISPSADYTLRKRLII